MLKCPLPEKILEYLSLKKELPVWQSWSLSRHIKHCPSCRNTESQIQSTLETHFTPELDITSSLIRVYSRLQEDETLVLNGWKLNHLTPRRGLEKSTATANWIYRGAIASLGLALGLGLFYKDGEKPTPPPFKASAPLAQIRYEKDQRIQVQYVEPELLDSVEFQTIGTRR